MATTSTSLQADIGAKLSESSGSQKGTWKCACLTTRLFDGFVLGKWISRQRSFAARSKLDDVQIPQLHGIGLWLSLLLGLLGQFVTATASPGSGCGNSAFFAIPHGSGTIRCRCAREHWEEKKAHCQIVCLFLSSSTGAQVFVHDRATHSGKESPVSTSF